MAYPAKLTREKIYRDSKKWYVEINGPRAGAKNIINFCKQHAGKRILDFGCATGNYCLELKRLGFECVGVDINEEYIKIAQKRGVEALVIKEHLPFEENSFDTVIMLELLEHVQNPDGILKDAKRVAKKNILLTVPNNTEFDKLKQLRLTYEHMLEKDHINFFTKESLSNLLSKYFEKYYVKEEEPIFAHSLLPWYLRKPISLCIKLKFIRPSVYFRLYAECLV